jgi:histidinol-phosphate aminotransferase
MQINIDQLVRENIRKMKPYSSARHEFNGEASIFLDANENSFGSPLTDAYNRYPDPLQLKVKEKLSAIKGVPVENMFLGNGSDEVIDLLFRIFCEPGRENALLCPPTYGMYQVCADTNNVAVKQVPLLENFQLDIEGIANAIDPFTKLLFICSPNNPTGNSMRKDDIEVLLNNFDGIVVIDEAYINYSRQKSMVNELAEYPNLVVMQTLSKAWGLAGLRLGIAYASAGVILYMNKIKYPYNISTATQQLVLSALDNLEQVNTWTRTTVQQKEVLTKALNELSFVITVYPSDANFLLVKMDDAVGTYGYLVMKGIIVRDRSNVILCEGCLRITIGTASENDILLNALKTYETLVK